MHIAGALRYDPTMLDDLWSHRATLPTIVALALGLGIAGALAARGRHDRAVIEIATARPRLVGSTARVVEPSAESFTFTRENVLGTSFRLVLVTASRKQAETALQTALAEIERCRRIFSTYDPQSELSKINAMPWRSRRELVLSTDLARVLRSSLYWRKVSQGAFDPYLGDLIARWRLAAKHGDVAPAADVAAGGAQLAEFRIHKRKRDKKRLYTLTCARAGRFDLDGIAKGFIIDRALRAIESSVDGALLDIGGDIAVRGRSARHGSAWHIDVADARRPAENDRALDTIALSHMAIASSGGYARSMKIAKHTYSHILDPRTGRPAATLLGATVIAPDARTADALATALCVLEPSAGVALVDRQPVAACLLVDRKGRVHRSRDWTRFRPVPPRASGTPWPAGFALQIHFRLVDSRTPAQRAGKRGRFKRHGTAVWVDDASGRRVRLVTLWFDRDEISHVRKLRAFWREGWVLSGSGADYGPLRAVSRASRRPGEYTVVWDGRDDAGRPVPQGRYRVRIDINREHGPGNERHTLASIDVECRDVAVEGRAADQPELADVQVAYTRR